MAEAKKQSFFGGAAILAAGIIIVKIIGALFKIPLANVLEKEGNGIFNQSYYIYSVFLSVSTAGLPVALSKMVSEARSLGRERQAQQIFRVSFRLFFTLGALSFIAMWWGNAFFADFLENSKTALSIRALAPAVFCVGCLSAFRGYAQGCGNMTPTAVSQIIEAICKLFVGLGLAIYLLRIGKGVDVAAAGAITGVTIGTILSLVYMVVNYFRHRKAPRTNDTPSGTGAILRQLLKYAIPITLSSSMVALISTIDSKFVMMQLQERLHYTEADASGLYGTYGAAMNLYNLPASLMVALTASVIPFLSAALARKDRAGAKAVVNSSFRVTALLAFPMGLGLWALSEPIMGLLYPKYDSALGGALLAVLGIASLFVCVMLISNSVLQAHGQVYVSIVTMLIGGVIKIALNYQLVAIPHINIHGAPIGTLTCFATVAVLNLFFVSRTVEDPPNYFALFVKPLAASLVMAFCARGAYILLSAHLGAGGFARLLGVGVSMALAVVIYAVLVVALRIITKEDLALLPKGEKLGRLLHIK